MKLFKYIGHCLNTIFRMYQEPYCEEWDILLNKLIDSDSYMNISGYGYTATFKHKDKTHVVWIQNKYYGYACPYSYDVRSSVGDSVRPKFKTMLKLEEYINKKRFELM